MAIKTITRDGIIRFLKKEQGKRSLRTFAKDIGVSVSYLSDLYLGRRDPGPAILERFGMWKEVKTVYGRSA
jgi:transcriptional regulator with XRE-family HTH domain